MPISLFSMKWNFRLFNLPTLTKAMNNWLPLKTSSLPRLLLQYSREHCVSPPIEVKNLKTLISSYWFQRSAKETLRKWPWRSLRCFSLKIWNNFGEFLETLPVFDPITCIKMNRAVIKKKHSLTKIFWCAVHRNRLFISSSFLRLTIKSFDYSVVEFHSLKNLLKHESRHAIVKNLDAFQNFIVIIITIWGTE